jgi:hypothetical protein
MGGCSVGYINISLLGVRDEDRWFWDGASGSILVNKVLDVAVGFQLVEYSSNSLARLELEIRIE